MKKLLVSMMMILCLLTYSEESESKDRLMNETEMEKITTQQICIDGFVWTIVINNDSGDTTATQTFIAKNVPKTCFKGDY